MSSPLNLRLPFADKESMRLLFCFFSLMIATCSAKAEYRAFVLRIEKLANSEEYREVVSNLDPRHYQGYYPIGKDERIYYTSTWMCPGRTYGFAKICDNPRTPLLN